MGRVDPSASGKPRAQAKLRAPRAVPTLRYRAERGENEKHTAAATRKQEQKARSAAGKPASQHDGASLIRRIFEVVVVVGIAVALIGLYLSLQNAKAK